MDSSLLVVGTGRSGTNAALELMRGNSYFKHTDIKEDRGVAYKVDIPSCYLSKCDTLYLRWDLFYTLLTNNKHLSVLWTIRDPRDVCLSKIYRGQPGQDNRRLANDATIEGCLSTIQKMFYLYKQTFLHFGDRVKLVKMEDILTNTEQTAKDICQWFGISYEPSMIDFPNRMRTKYKRDRYKTIDTSQVGLYKRVNEIYNSFFSNSRYDIDYLFKVVRPLVKYFNYSL